MNKKIFILVSIITTNAQGFQISLASQQKLIDFAKTNITFTRAGTTAFMTDCLNESLYTRLFLPSCFDHLVDFLEFGKALPQRSEFNTEVLALFHQQLKQTQWVNAFAFVRILDKLPTLIEPQTEQRAITREKIKKVVFESIEQKFDLLKENPDQFFNTLSDELLAISCDAADARELYTLTLRFLEQACDKLIWSPEDREVTWECVCLIGNQLERLHTAGIVPSVRALNALCWSLVARYAYFIENSARDLGIQTLEKIQSSLQNETPSWLMIPESEQTLRSKKAYLEATLFESDFELRNAQ